MSEKFPYLWENHREHIYTVSELTRNIKRLLEEKFLSLWVEGEVSNVRSPTSGHVYLTLKDAYASLRVVAFKEVAETLKFKLKDGLKVLVAGRVSVYERRGEYQLIAQAIEPKGKGALQVAFEQLKEKLAKEGLFSPEHKKPLPLFPFRIGIVTSPTGAAIRDIIRVILRRFPRVHLLIYPVRVQGEGAEVEIAEAIDEFNRLEGIDVLIIARGGGSLEDLMPFNEEIVARSIFHSWIPIISAVGHEIDYCISDFVADVRAPTPSAAAEMVVGVMEDVIDKLELYREQMERILIHQINLYYEKLRSLEESYGIRNISDKLRQLAITIDESERKLSLRFNHLFTMKKNLVNEYTKRLESISPLAVLSRGYSITFKLPERMILSEGERVARKDKVEVRLYKGRLLCEVEEVWKTDEYK
ncbi:MAG TPA: exodeoxyribonuclease VII large subunit [Candidatus Omnitrophica bacterium]|nr:exodeoxyribonuclease VII large subunit [Candidatus Omnitrophota bacterium]